MSSLGDAIRTARTYLNDDGALVWSDSQLIPKAQEAHRELQTMLWNIGSPVVREQTSPIDVASGAVDLGVNQPTDMLTPFRIQEYATAAAATTAVDVTEAIFLPLDVAASSKLVYWAWRKELITFIPATTDRKVIVYYRKLLTVPRSLTDPIGILFGELYVGARASAIAHGSVGNKDAYATLTDVCKANFQMVVQAQRGQQAPPMRP